MGSLGDSWDPVMDGIRMCANSPLDQFLFFCFQERGPGKFDGNVFGGNKKYISPKLIKSLARSPGNNIQKKQNVAAPGEAPGGRKT